MYVKYVKVGLFKALRIENIFGGWKDLIEKNVDYTLLKLSVKIDSYLKKCLTYNYSITTSGKVFVSVFIWYQKPNCSLSMNDVTEQRA